MVNIFTQIGFTFLTFLTVLSTFEPKKLLYVAIIIFLLLGIACSIKALRRHRVLMLCLSMSLLAAVTSYLNYNINIKYLEKFNDIDIEISGKLIDLPYKKSSAMNYLLKVDKVNSEKVKPFNIKLTCSEPLEMDIYDRFTGKIHTYSPRNVPEFNLKAYYRSKSIHVLGYIYNFTEYKVEKSVKYDWYYYMLKLRYKLLSIPRHLFDSDISSMINAIFLGEKHNLSDETKRDFQDIGIYHLIAVSGVHLSIVTQFLFYILKKLKIKIKISYILVSIVAILFMAVSGFSISVTRAGTMLILSFLGRTIFRASESLNSLGMSVFLIAFLNPNSALDIGFWMSALATLGIVLFEPEIRKYIENKLDLINNPITNYIILTMSTSLAVSVFTIPIEILFFRKFSVIFMLSNLLILPLITIILNSLLILDLFYLIFPIGILSPLIICICLISRLTIYISKILTKVPFAVIPLDYKFVKLCVIFSIILIILQYILNKEHEYIKITLILCVLIFLTGFLSHRIFSHNNIELLIKKYSNSTNLFITKNSSHAGIVYSNKPDINYKLNFDEYDFLYLDTPNYPEIINNYIKNIVILPKSMSNYNEILSENIVRFDENLSMKFFKNILIEFFEIDKHRFSLININKSKILICFNGGDAEKLPENFRNCDILILCALPINHQYIEAKTIIISTNHTDSKTILSKLNKNLNLISLSETGNIYLNIDRMGAHKIRRSR